MMGELGDCAGVLGVSLRHVLEPCRVTLRERGDLRTTPSVYLCGYPL